MKWNQIYKCGNMPPSAGSVSRAKMEQRKAWAKEIAREAKRNGSQKEGGKHEAK